MENVPQPAPPFADYAAGLHDIADDLAGFVQPTEPAPVGRGPLAELLGRVVYLGTADDVSGAVLRGETGHAIAATVSIRGGAEIVSDSPHALRALAAHASEVADRLEARHTPTCAAAL